MFDAGKPTPDGLVGPDREPSTDRFAIYRNNVAVGLADALCDAFPAVRRIVGDEFFRAMARVHALREPPLSPILLDYGAKFPDFVAAFPPTASLPYLVDVARIERAWREAYHAAEAVPLGADAFVVLDRNRLPNLRLSLHPSLRLVRSRYPALTIWDMNCRDRAPGPVDLTRGEDALIVRPKAEVEARLFPPGGLDFVQALRNGKTVLNSATDAMSSCARFDTAANLFGLLETGAIIGLSNDDPERLRGGPGRGSHR